MKITIFQVKLVHSLIFWFLSACILYSLASALLDRITLWTWIAAGLVLIEGGILLLFGGTCPLTKLAERLGDSHGAVTDIFLPKWLADRIFPLCTTIYCVALVVLLVRLLR